MTTDYKIGTSLGGMSTLASLSITDPQALPVHYAEQVILGDGTARGLGWKQCEWRWARLYLAEVNVLQAYCPSSSASPIYIKTLNRGGGFQAYSATMIWPQVEPAGQSDCYFDFVIRFTELVEAST